MQPQVDEGGIRHQLGGTRGLKILPPAVVLQGEI
jgi:hypothetical protein